MFRRQHPSDGVQWDKVNWHLICVNDIKFRYLTDREHECRYLNRCAMVVQAKIVTESMPSFLGEI